MKIPEENGVCGRGRQLWWTQGHGTDASWDLDLDRVLCEAHHSDMRSQSV